MNTVDYLVIAIVVVSAIVGLMRGFLREAIGVITWVAAVFVAWRFGPALEPYLGGLLAGPQVRPWAARIIVLIAVLLLGAAVGALVVRIARLSIFSATDRFLGLLFGTLRGLVIIGVLVLICQTLHLGGERWYRTSLLIPYGEVMAGGLRMLAGDELSRLRHGPAAGIGRT